MFRLLRFRNEKETAYQAQQAKRAEQAQRWLVMGSGLVYALSGLFISATMNEPSAALNASSVALFVGAAILSVLTYTSFVRNRIELVPIVVALAFGWHNMIGLAVVPDAGAASAAILFATLGALVALMAPTVQTSIAALFTTALLAALSFGVVFPLQGIEISFLKTLGLAAPLYLIVVGLVMTLDHARREAFSYKHELARRATTDEISGVSNRGHIHQMAQNEFGRARRYKEPLSVVMVEIDSFDSVLDSNGPIALETLIQVFAGYCVVVMRHCDSFGRLDPKRFLAILPETPAKGAMVLAERMCRDLANLEVLSDGETLHFTVSIGVAEAHTNDKWGGDLLRRCAQALDDAIEKGRNNVVLAYTAPQAYANDTAPMMPSPIMPNSAQNFDMNMPTDNPQNGTLNGPMQAAG